MQSNPENKKFNYSIYNKLGQLLKSDTTTNKIDFSNSTKGLYLINLSIEGQSKTFKAALN